MNSSWRQGEQDTVTAILARAVQAYPDKVFLDFTGELHTYAAVDAGSSRLARGVGLKSLGVAAGDTVATLLDNNLDAVLALFAITKLGAVSVPVNTAYKGEFLRHQINDARAKVVLAEADYGERLAAIADRLPDIHTVALRGAAPPR